MTSPDSQTLFLDQIACDRLILFESNPGSEGASYFSAVGVWIGEIGSAG